MTKEKKPVERVVAEISRDLKRRAQIKVLAEGYPSLTYVLEQLFEKWVEGEVEVEVEEDESADIPIAA